MNNCRRRAAHIAQQYAGWHITLEIETGRHTVRKRRNRSGQTTHTRNVGCRSTVGALVPFSAFSDMCRKLFADGIFNIFTDRGWMDKLPDRIPHALAGPT